nr:hypothetical protein CFP56_01292 [Quercus suber]
MLTSTLHFAESPCCTTRIQDWYKSRSITVTPSSLCHLILCGLASVREAWSAKHSASVTRQGVLHLLPYGPKSKRRFWARGDFGWSSADICLPWKSCPGFVPPEHDRG